MFQILGDKAQWRMVFDHLATMDIGDVITYEKLAEILPRTPEGSRRGAFLRAAAVCEIELHRAFDNVRGVGYRMVEAQEHERLARNRHRRGHRQVKRARQTIASADRGRLTREQRVWFDAIELNLARQAEITARIESRQAKTEADVRDVRRETKTDVAALSERVERLTEALARHGITT